MRNIKNIPDEYQFCPFCFSGRDFMENYYGEVICKCCAKVISQNGSNESESRKLCYNLTSGSSR